MLQELITRLNRYANRELLSADFEDWLVANLQRILDSRDQDVIDLANRLDGLFVEMSEGLITEEQLQEYATQILRERDTVLVAADAGTDAVTSDSAVTDSMTIKRDLRQVVEVFRQFQFA